jgi:O-acetyl-ADP-ribose deacetylase (regulator of RNase III)
MENMIKLCLNMAVADNFSTIAFPSVGCGKLGYSPSTVIDCFVKALQATKTDIEVTCFLEKIRIFARMSSCFTFTLYQQIVSSTRNVILSSKTGEIA